MTKLDANTAVNMLNQGGFFSPVYQFAEKYTGAPDRCAYVTKAEKKNYEVEVVHFHKRSESLLMALSRKTYIVPAIMKGITVWGRRGCDFEVKQEKTISPTSSKQYVMIKPPHKAAVLDEEEIKLKYKPLFQAAQMDLDQATAMVKHVMFFADRKTSHITRKSIEEGLNRLPGISKAGAFFQSLEIFYGLADFKEMRKGYMTLESINHKGHLADTGVFDKDGNLDEDKLTNLKGYSKTEYFTKKDRDAVHEENTTRDKGKWGFWKGNLASSKEFGVLFSFAKAFEVDNQGNASPAILKTDIDQFYRDGYLFWEKLAAEKSAAKVKAG